MAAGTPDKAKVQEKGSLKKELEAKAGVSIKEIEKAMGIKSGSTQK